MELRRLILKDKDIFKKYSSYCQQRLSVYAFANVFTWKPIYNIFWALIEDNLCIFFKDKTGCFMNLEPMGKNKTPSLIRKCFAVMDSFNLSPAVSRIENVEEKNLAFYRRHGYNCVYKTKEYLYLSTKMADLKGDAFKSKRSGCNYFQKHYAGQYRPYRAKDKKSCLLLYSRWMKQRKDTHADSLYGSMLEDNLFIQKTALNNYLKLDFLARVVTVNKIISAYALGYPIDAGTFCIFSEIADLNIKGLPQYIFREFSRELKGYKYINVMDDLGLENLAKVKLSYRPEKLIPVYNIERYE